MRHAIGRGTPRGLQGRRRPCFVLWLTLYTFLAALGTTLARCIGVPRSLSRSGISSLLARRNVLTAMTFTTGC